MARKKYGAASEAHVALCNIYVTQYGLYFISVPHVSKSDLRFST